MDIGYSVLDIGYLYALAYLNFKYINPLKTQKSQKITSLRPAISRNPFAVYQLIYSLQTQPCG